MYARLLLLRSSKLGCFPRRLASSSSGPRVPEQAVRAIFLIFRLSFLPRADRSIWPGPDDPDDWLTDFCIADSIFNTLGRACFSIEHRSSSIFLTSNGLIITKRSNLEEIVWREWNLDRRCFLKFFVFPPLETLERKKYITMFVQLKRYETDLGRNFKE